jgi:NADH-quinone oxidoreductase subunit G
MDIASAELSNADAIFLIGSNLRQDQPILGHRVRTAWRRHGAAIMDLNPAAYDFHFDLAERLTVAPQAMVEPLARVTRAAIAASGTGLPDGPLGDLLGGTESDAAAVRMVAALKAAERSVILLGDVALNHPQASWLRALAECLAQRLDVSLCVLPGPANSQGAWSAGTVPGDQGLSVDAMLSEPRRGYLLVDLEPSLDTGHPYRAMGALRAAETVVAMTTFAGPDLLDAADVLLPMAAVAETAGSYVNLDGTRQAFNAAIKPPGQAREGWKILRRLGEMLGLDGFDFVALEAVVDSLQADAVLPPETSVQASAQDLADRAGSDADLARIGDVPMFAGDALVRRSKPLQQTHHADASVARIHPATAERLGLSQTSRVRVRQDEGNGVFELQQDTAVAVDALWLPSATAEAASLGPSYGPVSVEDAGQ